MALSAGIGIVGILDPEYRGQTEDVLGVPVLGDLDELSEYRSLPAFLAFGDNVKRARIQKELTEAGVRFCNLVHRSAIVNQTKVMELRYTANGGHLLIMESGEEVRVGRTYSTAISQRFGRRN